MDTIHYSDIYDPACPWGYWLQPVTNLDGEIGYEEGDGTIWCSVRHAFWAGRLCMPASFLCDETLDLVAEVLESIDSAIKPPSMRVGELGYEGKAWHSMWLNSVGLVEHGPNGPLSCLKLTDEGAAALIMLKMTKRHASARGWTPRRIFSQHLVRWPVADEPSAAKDGVRQLSGQTLAAAAVEAPESLQLRIASANAGDE